MIPNGFGSDWYSRVAVRKRELPTSGQKLGFAGGQVKSVTKPWLCEDIARL